MNSLTNRQKTSNCLKFIAKRDEGNKCRPIWTRKFIARNECERETRSHSRGLTYEKSDGKNIEKKKGEKNILILEHFYRSSTHAVCWVAGIFWGSEKYAAFYFRKENSRKCYKAYNVNSGNVPRCGLRWQWSHLLVELEIWRFGGKTRV